VVKVERLPDRNPLQPDRVSGLPGAHPSRHRAGRLAARVRLGRRLAAEVGPHRIQLPAPRLNLLRETFVDEGGLLALRREDRALDVEVGARRGDGQLDSAAAADEIGQGSGLGHQGSLLMGSASRQRSPFTSPCARAGSARAGV
ncbi:hypothetical protein FK268_23085, partial [Tsukamurella sputi]